MPETITRRKMELAAYGVLSPHMNNGNMTWLHMFREWIDNSLDARAKHVLITREDNTLSIEDDGCGAESPHKILSMTETEAHDEQPRAGHYGLGGKVSNIRASQGTRTEAHTVRNGMIHHVRADWRSMMELNDLSVEQWSTPVNGQIRGTRIVNYNCRKFKDVEKLSARLGFDYADVIASGVSITLRIDGRESIVSPYALPPFSDQVDFAFDYHGMKVTGFCGVVKEGHVNPSEYQGWTFHWGPHRVLTTTTKPADGKWTARIQGHVYLPTAWKSFKVNLTKDGFDEEPIDLYDMIGSECAEIIEQAQDAAENHDLQVFTDKVNSILNTTLPVKVKGRRDYEEKDLENEGISPKETGQEHKRFSKSQPGTKGTNNSPSKLPHQYRVYWQAPMDDPWSIVLDGVRNVTASLTFNAENDMIRGYRDRDEHEGFAAFCAAIISIHLTINKSDQQKFGLYELGETHQVFDALTKPLLGMTS